MRKGIAISAAAVALATTTTSISSASASTGLLERGPDGVTIEIATVNGSGCPIGTTAVAVSEDKEAFTVTYSDYMAQVGGDAKPTDRRKNCQISMKVHVPQGFTYAISSTDHRGYAFFQPGATGVQLANYYFQGSSGNQEIPHQLPKGPFNGSWQATDKVPVDQLVYKPCGELKNFNINTQLRVDPGTSDPTKSSFASMDSTDGSIKTTYHFAWKKCP
ncbi:DUF4360 domain-containing protein [Actinomadura macra]|uniref:DUF4360 domain-containing protein n=1 Tax=Actinomadura macra TaxID=46164 RepID=UPI00082F4E4D|nr:DUF4360 domain-containing protein [Actinomadura macra]